MRKWLKTINTIRFEVQQGVARVTLNRPEKRNALNLVMLREIRDALLEADDLRAVHCVVLSGEGKDFCSGWDLVSATTPNDATVAQNPAADYRSEIETVDDDTWQLERMLELRMLVFDMHKPVIAQIHGNCLANGTDLAFYADIIIAANDAKIGYPPVRAQGSPAAHMWLYHLGPQWAKRMLLTGDLISGKDAAKIGLVLKSVPESKLKLEVESLAARFAAVSPDLLACNKRIVNLGLELMGARTLQRLASEMDARGHLSAGRLRFRDAVKQLGLKEALKLRDAAFGDGQVHLDDKT